MAPNVESAWISDISDFARVTLSNDRPAERAAYPRPPPGPRPVPRYQVPVAEARQHPTGAQTASIMQIFGNYI